MVLKNIQGGIFQFLHIEKLKPEGLIAWNWDGLTPTVAWLHEIGRI